MMSSMASRGSDRPAAIVSIPTGPPPKLSAIIVEIATVELIEAERIDLKAKKRLVSNLARDVIDAGDGRKVADAPQKPSRNARRAACPACNLQRAIVAERHAQNARSAPHDLFQFLDGVEIQPYGNAETVAQRIGQQTEPRRRRNQREFGKIDLDRARRRPFADDQVELVVLHRRIEDLLHRRVQPVDLVDEQHVAVFEVGEQGGKIAGLGDDRPGGGAEIDAKLSRHDLRERGLAKTRRTDEQHVIERLATTFRGFDEHLEIGPRRGLSDEFVERLRAKRHFRVFAARFRGDKARGEAHRPVFACDE